ncbi:unnamed protein product [Parajaminaea phylloscopi]
MSFPSLHVALALVFAVAVLPVQSFWILSHHPLVSQRLDPIVAPNGLSSHTHTFVGSAAIQDGQNVDTMCTTADVKADRSKYWAPQLYYFNAGSATFDSVPLSFVNTYYLNRGGPKMGENSSLLQPFPKGLRMIAGNAGLYDGPNSDPTKAKAVSFVCLASPGSQTTTIPNTVCPGGMRAQIVFPSCWDGKNLDSPDHQSHVAYPINGNADTGDCPATHPVKFMTLFYEYIFSTGSLKNSETGGFVLANGDAMGWSFHADFVAGWDETVLKSAIDQCSGNLFGDLKSCPPFVPTLHPETASPKSSDPAAGFCTTGSAVSEKVLGTGFKSLPGCQMVRNGPFKGAGACGANTTTVANITATPSTSTPSDVNYRGCFQEPTGNRALPTKVNVASNSVSACSAACAAAGFSVAGMEYGTECWCANALTAGSNKVSDDFCNMGCGGDSTQTCGGNSLLSVYSTKPVTVLSAPSIPKTAATPDQTYVGCFKEGTSGRALSGASYANKANTPAQCATFCSAKGFQYSGTEYGSECYCGSSITTTLAADSECSMTCSGDASQLCGAGSRVQVYKDAAWKQSLFTVMQQGQWNYTDCAVDSPRQRLLANRLSTSKATVDACLAACAAKKYTYCGTEYSGECYGANVLPATWASAPADAAGRTDTISRGCSMPCTGNTTLTCGGNARMDLYTFFATASPLRSMLLA